MQYKAGPGSEGIAHNLTSLLIHCDEERERERKRDKDRETMVTAALCNKPVVSYARGHSDWATVSLPLSLPLSLSFSHYNKGYRWIKGVCMRAVVYVCAKHTVMCVSVCVCKPMVYWVYVSRVSGKETGALTQSCLCGCVCVCVMSDGENEGRW